MSQPILTRVVQHLRQTVGAPDEAVADAQLLERFLRNRDEVAFELLVRRHERLVLGVCRRVLRNPHDADDAFQATFLLLVRKASSIRKHKALAAWLHQVAYRIALRANSEARKRAERETTEVDPAGLPSREPDPAALPLNEFGALLDEELHRLPEKYRAVVALCCLEGCTYEEAAQRLGVPRGTVSTWLTRGRELLRSRLTRRGAGVATVALASVPGPPLTAAPVSATVRTVLDGMAGRVAAGTASARAAALAEGVLRTMFLTKLKIATAALLTLALVTGSGLLAVPSPSENPGPALPSRPQNKDRDDEGLPDASARNPGLGASGKERAADPEKDPRIPDGRGSASWQEILKIESHKGAVLAAAFSPDAKRLATGGAEGLVKILDAATGKEIQTLWGHGEPIFSIAFAPDGKWLASGGLGKVDGAKVRLWDVTTGKLLAQAVTDTPVNSVAFSPKGKRLIVGGHDRTVRALALDSFDLDRLWSAEFGGVVAAVAVSPDGQRVCAVGAADLTDKRYLGTALRVLDAVTGKLVFVVREQTDKILTAAFSPDGTLLASGGPDRTIRLHDARTGKAIRQLTGHTGAVTSVAFAPDAKRLASGSADHTIRIWDVATGQVVETITLDRPVAVVIFSPDGRFLLAASGRVVRLWQAKPGRVVDTLIEGQFRKAGGDRLDGLLRDLLQRQRGDEQVLEALFLASLGRLPSDVEKKFGLGHVSKAKDRREAFADLLFQLTHTKEFAEHARGLNERAQRRPPR